MAKNDGGTMFTPAYLYDKDGNEIGVTTYTNEAIAYAMAHHPSIETAKTYDRMFGEVIVERKSFSDSAFEKVKDKKKYGENLLFWVGPPILVRK